MTKTIIKPVGVCLDIVNHRDRRMDRLVFRFWHGKNSRCVDVPMTEGEVLDMAVEALRNLRIVQKHKEKSP